MDSYTQSPQPNIAEAENPTVEQFCLHRKQEKF